MRRIDLHGTFRTAGWAASLLPGLVSRAAAQCPMCGQAAAYAGSKPGAALATFGAAALVLLVPVLLMMTGVGLLLWKHRH